MSDDLPMGWVKTELGEIGEWSSGGTPSRKQPEYYGGSIPWVKTGDLNNSYIESVEEFITEDGLKNSSAKIFPSGTLLLAMYGATIGKTGVLRIEAATNQACGALIAEGFTRELIPFLRYFLIHKVDEFKSIGQGGAQPNISQTIIKQFAVSLPPLNEQRRIVDKLDRIGDRNRTARNELNHIPKLIARYKQAVLAAAFRGDLTADWRKEENINYINHGIWIIPSNWEWGVMSDVCEHITKGTTPSQDKMNATDCEQIPFIKVYNLTFNGTLDFSIEPTFVSLETHENFLKRSKVYPNDVLMNIVGPPLGKVSIVPDSFPEWNINQAIAIFRAKPVIFNKYISNFLIFNKTVNWCIRQAKATAGQFNLT